MDFLPSIFATHMNARGNGRGAVMFTGLSRSNSSTWCILEIRLRPDRSTTVVRDYVAPYVSEKVVRAILSYTDYVNPSPKKFPNADRNTVGCLSSRGHLESREDDARTCH